MTIESNNTTSSEFLNQILISIKALNELTTRLDERVKVLLERQKFLEDEIDKIASVGIKASERIAIIERDDTNDIVVSLKAADNDYDKRLHKLETDFSQVEGRRQKIWNFVIQVIYAVVTCYILWKIGLGNVSPP